jgi:hypothetical protein
MRSSPIYLIVIVFGEEYHIQWVLGEISSGIKQPGREADHSPSSIAEVKNGGAIPPSSIFLHGILLN